MRARLKKAVKHTFLEGSKKATVALFILLLIFIFYHVVYANRVIPGVKVGAVPVGGKTSAQLEAALKDKLTQTQLDIKFSYNGKEFHITSADIDLSYSTSGTVAKLLRLGRTGNFIVDSKDKLAAIIKGIKLSPAYKYDSNKLNRKISEIEGIVTVEHKDPTFILSDKGDLTITDASEGSELNKETLRAEIFSAIDNYQSLSFELPVEKVIPANSKEDLESVKTWVQAIIDKSPAVRYEDRTWIYEKQDLLSLLTFRKENGQVKVLTSKTALSKLADDLATQVDVEARGEVFKTEGDRVIEFKPKIDGKYLDKDKFRKDFSKALLTENKEVNLAVNQTKAPGDTNKYGIYSLLGEGVSYFHGSIPGRIRNLTLAAQRASGVLVAPGDTYSFNKSVGEISLKTGYDVAYIINNGRTVLGEGGGVCQASTTLFRAALSAGLPIVKRSAHAYRVHYYEENSEVGLDATVFSPNVDFQFKNDTPGYILIQTDWDLDKYMLRFKIYGTPDGRTVEVTKPVVAKVTPPPEALYQDDPTLQKGVVKQVDFSAWGASVSFERTVKRSGQVILHDTFVSNYQPWRAIYLKGTKE